MNDRRLGYFLLILLVGLVTGFTTYFVWVHLFPAERWVIAFDRIGNLKIEDPVTIHGLQIGRVETVEYAGGTVLVGIRTTEPLKLHEKYSISVVDKGLMGERTILIDRGRITKNAISPGDTLKGSFAPGVSEALDNTRLLKQAVSDLRVAIARARHGTDSQSPFATRFIELMRAVDSLSEEAVVMGTELEGDLSLGLDSVQAALTALSSYSEYLATTLPTYVELASGLIPKAEKAIATLESAVQSLTKVLSVLDEQEKTLFGETLAQLQAQLEEIRNAVDRLRSDGLPLQVRIVR